VTTFGSPPDDPQQPSPGPAEPQPAAPSGAGTLSPDGRWIWDGAQWTPAPVPPPAPPPPYGSPPAYGHLPSAYPPPSGYGAPPPGYAPPPPGYPAAYPGYAAPSVGPAPGLAYAGFWVRVGAAAIDGLILTVPIVVFIIITAVAAGQDGGGNNGVVAIGVIGIILTAIGACLYQVVLPAQGGTWGMRMLNLRVARADNCANIGIPLALGRWAVMTAISLVWLGWLDVLWVAWDPRKQALHDKAVNTFVVRPLV
jgi:uncharacterized RDD family membrane protein YckC